MTQLTIIIALHCLCIASCILSIWTHTTPGKMPTSTRDSKASDPTSRSANTSEAAPKIKDIYQNAFDNRSSCNAVTTSPGFVIVIPSKVTNYANRQYIRETWGTTATKENVPLRFFVGLNPNGNIDPEIVKEKNKYKDIVILKNVVDSFQNMTLKMLSIFEWTQKCSTVRFVVRCDDDVFINITKLHKLVKKHWKKKKCILGNKMGGSVIRDIHSKYYVSTAQYPEKSYPTYVSGGLYMLDIISIQALFDESLESIYIPIDDAFLMGIIREKLGIGLIEENQLMYFLENGEIKCTGYVGYHITDDVYKKMNFLLKNC